MIGAPSKVIATSARAWYSAEFGEFQSASSDLVIGRLATASTFSIETTQRDAWAVELAILREHLSGLSGRILLEFTIPRLGGRIDAVLLFPRTVVVVEFKVGATQFDRGAIEQVWDYALDLKNFHSASHDLTIVPVLVATDAKHSVAGEFQPGTDGVYAPVCVAPQDFRPTLDSLLAAANGNALDPHTWQLASYRPTPTIVEAARSLYAEHSVLAIARNDAGAKNLASTSGRVESLIDEARTRKRKVICFVTGVPGAGKTLVGLNIATKRHETGDPTHAVFLSGNGPLVNVLREALTRDEVARKRAIGERVRKGVVGEKVKAFIQNVHHFRDEALVDTGAPADHVVVFDEAQRAWNLAQTASFMRRKKGQPSFAQSEPQFLINYMDRHKDWAAVVCLVGGGQEINTGEAGIDTWIEAVASSFPDWHMYISDRLTDTEYGAGVALQTVKHRPNTHPDDELHLGVSMRSFRAEKVSAFVKALLDCDESVARNTLADIIARYPIAATRDLSVARRWLRARARGSERHGLVASSRAMRLKPHAIDIRVSIDPVQWFLNDRDDTRSSLYLEDAATEFQVQGLELDWACVAWDGDLRYSDSCWDYRDFRGTRWEMVRNDDRKRYLLNAYRVLLTRARQGMVLFIPPGDTGDPTRKPEYYDKTFSYLVNLGIPVLPQ